MLSGHLATAILAAALAAGAPAPPLEADVICTVNGEPLRLRDLELALYLDDYPLFVKNVLPFIVQERAVRQAMGAEGVAVRTADVSGYLRDLDARFRASQKTTLKKYLASINMDEGFFRRKIETTLGLYRLAGGKERPSRGMSDPLVQRRMNKKLAELVDAAEVVSQVSKLPAGVAVKIGSEKVSVGEAARIARLSFSAEHKKKRLYELQRFMVVRQELGRRGLKFTKDDLDYQMKLASEARATKVGEKEFSMERILSQLGREVALLKRQHGFRRVAMLTKMVKGGVNADALRKLFAADPARFGEGVPKASHILIKTVGEDGRPLSRGERRKAKRLAEKLHRQLRAGEDFAKLAGRHSGDKRTADDGGNLGFLDVSAAERASDPVARTAYGLKVGEVSPPVLGRRGWHIVKVTEIHRTTFERAKPLVLAAAVRAKRNALERELLKAAKVAPGPARY